MGKGNHPGLSELGREPQNDQMVECQQMLIAAKVNYPSFRNYLVGRSPD